MSKVPKAVVDTDGVRHTLGKCLGQGGQGAVYRVVGKPLAVKLVNTPTTRARRQLDARLAAVRRLPLDGLNVARPLRTLIAPDCGYVMELMTGMQPISAIGQVPQAEAEDFAPWYLRTGSLERRLRLWGATAELLAQLHGRGLCFGDVSPNNIFVSEAQGRSEVWLIDCDNLTDQVEARPMYTQGYGAPELFVGHGADSLTDAWSFAVAMFESLCVIHPFDGDDVHDGEPEMEVEAFEGRLPWIDDPSEENFASRGLPRPMVFAPKLMALAQRCFGDSRTSRRARPGLGEWAEALRRAEDQCVFCPGCTSSYLATHRACPWCDAPRPQLAVAAIYTRDPALKKDKDNDADRQLVSRRTNSGKKSPVVLFQIVLQSGRSRWLGDSHLNGEIGPRERIRLTLKGTDLHIEVSDGLEWGLAERSRKPTAGSGALDLSQGRTRQWLAPTDQSRPHRVIDFSLVPGDVQ